MACLGSREHKLRRFAGQLGLTLIEATLAIAVGGIVIAGAYEMISTLSKSGNQFSSARDAQTQITQFTRSLQGLFDKRDLSPSGSGWVNGYMLLNPRTAGQPFGPAYAALRLAGRIAGLGGAPDQTFAVDITSSCEPMGSNAPAALRNLNFQDPAVSGKSLTLPEGGSFGPAPVIAREFPESVGAGGVTKASGSVKAVSVAMGLCAKRDAAHKQLQVVVEAWFIDGKGKPQMTRKTMGFPEQAQVDGTVQVLQTH
jgi:hypothetical protein